MNGPFSSASDALCASLPYAQTSKRPSPGAFPPPSPIRDRKVIETVSAGIPEIDSLAGGLPRGSLTEICGPPCSGRTSLLLSALAARTAQPEACALIDGRDAFDPYSAEAAGVKLNNLLWVDAET